MASIIAGSICSVTIVYLLAKGIHLDSAVMKSMLPQAATTAIALPLSKGIGASATSQPLRSSLTLSSYMRSEHCS